MILDGLKIGCVPYLNALPLVYGLEGDLVRLPPTTLAKLLKEGLLDIALGPSFLLCESERFTVVPGVCISSRGPIRSIRLFYRGRLSRIRRVAVDFESSSAYNLVRVILWKRFGLTPDYVRAPELRLRRSPYDALLLIGDKAIRHREWVSALDLGEEWTRLTGLPFVYAFWIVRQGVEAAEAARRFREAKAAGLAHLDEIVAGVNGFSKRFLRHYFAHNVRYDLGEEELAGFAQYTAWLKEAGVIDHDVTVRFCC